MKAAGLTEDDLDTAEVWPENWPAFDLFTAMGTQWRTGMNGPTGLDYNVLYHKLDRKGLSLLDYEQMEIDIAVMERAALTAIQTKD